MSNLEQSIFLTLNQEVTDPDEAGSEGVGRILVCIYTKGGSGTDLNIPLMSNLTFSIHIPTNCYNKMTISDNIFSDLAPVFFEGRLRIRIKFFLDGLIRI